MNVLGEGKVDLIDYMGTDLTVVNAARVSFNKESEWGLDFDAIERLKSCPYNKDDVRLLKEKDINEMILSGKTIENIVDYINENTYGGILAQAALSQWERTTERWGI